MADVFENPSDMSEHLFRIVDNGGSSADRYTVLFSDGSHLALSDTPWTAQGISLSGDGIDPATLSKWVEEGEAVDLALGDLPPGLADHIMKRCNEDLEDFLADVESKHPDAVAPNRGAAKENEGLYTSLGDGIYDSPEGYRIKLDGDPEDDRGPFKTARDAVLASMPDQYGLAGPEYHSTTDVTRLEPNDELKAKVAELEARREAEWTVPGPGM